MEGNSLRVGMDLNRSRWSGSHDTQSGSRLVSLNFSRDTARSSTATSEEPKMEPMMGIQWNLSVVQKWSAGRYDSMLVWITGWHYCKGWQAHTKNSWEGQSGSQFVYSIHVAYTILCVL